MGFELTLSKRDLEEIKRFSEDKLPPYLLENLTSFEACALILQSIFDKVNEVMAAIEEE